MDAKLADEVCYYLNGSSHTEAGAMDSDSNCEDCEE